MHLKYKMWMEWGIGGLKRKYRWSMKMFDSTKPKYIILFIIAIILTNFLQGHWIDFTFEIMANKCLNLLTMGGMVISNSTSLKSLKILFWIFHL
jgi:hypothetical protein